ncbi:MAG TPA: hypothetical protein VNF68_02325 [Candidatus Baltobacteraceae bacterium]|nr:hypothetical protein [Candidatus Baltobacteraceae bacterium]
MRVAALALAVGAFAASFAPAFAENLQRLTVTQLVLSADTAQPKLEVPFHLIVTAHVRERIASLENVDLPILTEVELLGDEHSLVSAANGSTYKEVITVVAHHTGAITIAPVTLDAIDARTGKPMRYSSNPLTIAVGGGSLVPTVDVGAIAWRIVRVIVYGLCAVALILVVVLVLRRKPTPALEVMTLPQATPVEPRPQRNARDVFGDALVTLRADRTRATVLRVRHVARSMVGASDVETLADALRRPLAAERRMRDLLTTLERAAFTYDGDLQTAITHAIAALERLTV